MRLRPLYVSVLALVSACSSSSDETPATQPPAKATFVARFEIPAAGKPDFLQVPFPTDAYLASDGTIDIPLGNPDDLTGLGRIMPKLQGMKFVQDALKRTHGYGVYAASLFEISGADVDSTKLPKGQTGDCLGADAAIALVDLDTGKAVECMAGFNNDKLFDSSSDAKTVLTVKTARGVVLPEAHRIAVLVTNRVVSKAGESLSASESFVALRDGNRTSDLAKVYGAAIDQAVAKTGIDKSRVVSAAVYTTGKVTDELRKAREIMRKESPALKWGKDDVAPVVPARFVAKSPLPDGWTATLDDYMGLPSKIATGPRAGEDEPDWGADDGIAHDGIGSIGHAVFDAPNFLIDKADGYLDAAHGTFFHDGSGNVAINPEKKTAKLWVTFVVPKGPMPAAGWPVVVYQHGMGGQRGSCLTMANLVAKRGYAVASIEARLQGTRADDAKLRGDKKNNYRRTGSKYEGPDGFTDTTGDGNNAGPTDLFGGLFRLAAMRDQFRQTAIDHSAMVKLLEGSPTLDGLTLDVVAPKIDGSKIAYFGDSLGGIIGSLVSGIEPGHKAYILNVPGGGILSDLATNSPEIYRLLNGAAALNFGFLNAQVAFYHPLVQLMQHVVDGGDPIAVAGTAITNLLPIDGKIPTPRNILMFEVLADELVSNESTESLARAMDLRLVKPSGQMLTKLETVDGASAGGVPKAGYSGLLVQMYPAQHGYNLIAKFGQRTYATPRPIFGDPGAEPFPLLSRPKSLQNPYMEGQAAVIQFLADAFAGKAPKITWTLAPKPVD